MRRRLRPHSFPAPVATEVTAPAWTPMCTSPFWVGIISTVYSTPARTSVKFHGNSPMFVPSSVVPAWVCQLMISSAKPATRSLNTMRVVNGPRRDPRDMRVVH